MHRVGSCTFRTLRGSLLLTAALSLLAARAGEAQKEAYADPKEAKQELRDRLKAPPAPKPPPELVPMPALTWASEKLKKLPLGSARFSFGIEHRTRVEVWDNKFLGGGATITNGFTLFRHRVWMDADLHEHVRVFGMFQDAHKDGDIAPQARAHEDRADLLEGYLDLRKLFGQDLTLRVGRQPLVYGRQRLVGAFEWSNPGRRFDALKLMWKSPDQAWTADAFASKVVEIDAIHPDEMHSSEEFYGLYATNASLKPHRFDLYALYRSNEIKERDQEIVTLGFRAYGKGLFGGLDYEVEAAGQFGKTPVGADELDHRAAAAHAEVGWTFAPAWKPRIMAEFNYASGDKDPTDGENQTFNNLFPTNHLHYGYADFFNWSNQISVAAGFEAQPLSGMTVWSKAYWFRLAEEKDAWRNAGGVVLARDTTGRAGREVGFEFDVGTTVNVNRHLNVELGYALFDGGEFTGARRPPGQGETAQFFWAQAVLKF